MDKQLITRRHIEKKDIIIAVLIILFVFAVGYIIDSKIKTNQEIYNLGVLEWNNNVINKIKYEGVIPIMANGTEQFVSLEQLCGG